LLKLVGELESKLKDDASHIAKQQDINGVVMKQNKKLRAQNNLFKFADRKNLV